MDAGADLVRRDGDLNGLGLLLDPGRLIEALGNHLDTARVDHIGLDYLRYKPGMNCLARYRLQSGKQVITAYAKAHGKDANKKLSKSGERPVSATFLGPGRVELRQQGIIFSLFPNDAKLFSLQSLGKRKDRFRLLSRVFGSHSPWNEARLVEVLNYKPERRYVARLLRPDGKAALAKFYSSSGYARAHAISRKLNVSRNPMYPETMGRSKKYAVVAYRWQPGMTLRQRNIQGVTTGDELKEAARSLAQFHAAAGTGLSAQEPGELGSGLIELAAQLGFLLPELRQEAQAVARHLSHWLAEQPPVRVPLHGDFYDKQVIVHAGKATLIDFDAACLGNPLMDLANYIAHLENMVNSYRVTNVDVVDQREVLLTAYQDYSGGLALDQIDRYVALSLFRLIHHPFRSWVDDWPGRTEKLLSRVTSLCDL